MPDNWKSLPPGVLNDKAIRDAAATLFKTGFRPDSVKQCCYEFHVGDQVIDLAKEEDDRITPIGPDDCLLICPRSSVVVKLEEEISIPTDCLARFLLKGKFFSAGLAPINTYADPGFDGQMGMVLTNNTSHYIRIPRGESLAKAEFTKLPKAVETGYRGQHGFHTGHWPIIRQFKAKSEDLKAKGIVPDSHEQIRIAHGQVIADTVAQLRYYSVVMWIQLAIVTLGLLTIIHYCDRLGTGMSLGIGIVGNLVAAIAVAVVRRRLPERWRGEL